MPILKGSRTEHKVRETPELPDSAKVWTIRFTKECFDNYEDYLKQLGEYRKRQWQKENLTYEEALLSERAADKKLQSYPMAYEGPTVAMAHHNTGTLTAIVDRIYDHFCNMCEPGERVRVQFGPQRKEVAAVVLRRIELDERVPVEKVGPAAAAKKKKMEADGGTEDEAAAVELRAKCRYVVEVDRRALPQVAEYMEIKDCAEAKETEEVCVVDEEQVKRKLPPLQKKQIREFIRSATGKTPGAGAPWVMNDELAKKYGLPTTLPPELERLVAKGGARKRGGGGGGGGGSSSSSAYPKEDALLTEAERADEGPFPTGLPAATFGDPQTPHFIDDRLCGRFLFCATVMSLYEKPLELQRFGLEDLARALFAPDTSPLLDQVHMRLLHAVMGDLVQQWNSRTAPEKQADEEARLRSPPSLVTPKPHTWLRQLADLIRYMHVRDRTEAPSDQCLEAIEMAVANGYYKLDVGARLVLIHFLCECWTASSTVHRLISEQQKKKEALRSERFRAKATMGKSQRGELALRKAERAYRKQYVAADGTLAADAPPAPKAPPEVLSESELAKLQKTVDDATRKIKELNAQGLVRLQPLGRDRHYRNYWAFEHDDTHRLYVETIDHDAYLGMRLHELRHFRQQREEARRARAAVDEESDSEDEAADRRRSMRSGRAAMRPSRTGAQWQYAAAADKVGDDTAWINFDSDDNRHLELSYAFDEDSARCGGRWIAHFERGVAVADKSHTDVRALVRRVGPASLYRTKPGLPAGHEVRTEGAAAADGALCSVTVSERELSATPRWTYVASVEQLDAIVAYLNPKGVRESKLLAALEERGDALRKKVASPVDALWQVDTGLARGRFRNYENRFTIERERKAARREEAAREAAEREAQRQRELAERKAAEEAAIQAEMTEDGRMRRRAAVKASHKTSEIAGRKRKFGAATDTREEKMAKRAAIKREKAKQRALGGTRLASRRGPSDDDSDDLFCTMCHLDKDDDQTLLCDMCENAFHTYCVDPPLREIPKGEWFCQACLLQIMKDDVREGDELWEQLHASGDDYEEDDDADMSDEIACEFCKSPGDAEWMLLCDGGCEKGYHSYCLNPPLKVLPRGDWFCDQCVPRRRSTRRRRSVQSSSSSEDDDEDEQSMSLGSDSDGMAKDEEEEEEEEEQQQQQPEAEAEQAAMDTTA